MADPALTELHGMTPPLLAALRRLNIHRALDLLFHLPLRYEDRSRITAAADLVPGQEALIEATISHYQIQNGQRRSVILTLDDHGQPILCRFFNYTPYQLNLWQSGVRVRAYGTVKQIGYHLELAHPELTILTAHPPPLPDYYSAIYPTTYALTQRQIRYFIRQLLEGEPLAELLPERLRTHYHWPEIQSALIAIHQPPLHALLEQVQGRDYLPRQRLLAEELLAHQLAVRQIRQRKRHATTQPLPPPQPLLDQLIAALPFQLTAAQQRVGAEISRDLAHSKPMQRLVQGDVGSGKTIVAALAALHAIGNGCQCALMAPTELLAEQHRNSFSGWFEPLGITTVWLTGRLKTKARRAVVEQIASGEAQLIIGTHALFQQAVEFARLGLVIIDEQHRFGVHQRLALQAKGGAAALQPHQLVMTATPIPRSLAMTAYGDLDLSIIDALPAGRQPIQTAVMSEQRRVTVLERVRHACQQGQQAYWICPLIEESEQLQCQAAESHWQQLQEQMPELSIGLLHGRLPAEQKERTMAAFKAGAMQLLVATTVVEVGVDVPNATLMVIDNAERLGLAQLHQLRGRVGRGAAASHCVLLYQSPLSDATAARLQVMRESQDGFYIAERDLALRGPGELLGTRQTGVVNYKIANLELDSHWLKWVQQWADQLLTSADPAVDRLIDRWLGEDADRYRQV